MSNEKMMAELRRIVGTLEELRAHTMASSAQSERAAAYARGRAIALKLVLEELAETFGIDPWSCEAKEGAADAI